MFGPNGHDIDPKEAAALGVAYIHSDEGRKQFAIKKGYDATKLASTQPEELH